MTIECKDCGSIHGVSRKQYHCPKVGWRTLLPKPFKKVESKTLKQLTQHEPMRMSYETYVFLKALLDEQLVKWEDKFRTACIFIPGNDTMSGKITGLDRAHKIFSVEDANLRRMKEELHTAAAATYKDHPNADMRKFWGLKE